MSEQRTHAVLVLNDGGSPILEAGVAADPALLSSASGAGREHVRGRFASPAREGGAQEGGGDDQSRRVIVGSECRAKDIHGLFHLIISSSVEIIRLSAFNGRLSLQEIFFLCDARSLHRIEIP
jgi:hypothetical protein